MHDKDGGQEDRIEERQDPTYSMTFKDVVDILEIIESATCRELDVQLGDLKMTVIKREHE